MGKDDLLDMYIYAPQACSVQGEGGMDMSGKSWLQMENDTQPVKNEDEREFYDTNFNF